MTLKGQSLVNRSLAFTVNRTLFQCRMRLNYPPTKCLKIAVSG